jgi:hypothetical protein
MGSQRYRDLPISIALGEAESTYKSTVGQSGTEVRNTEDGTELAGCGKWVPGVSRDPPGGPESGYVPASEQNRTVQESKH